MLWEMEWRIEDEDGREMERCRRRRRRKKMSRPKLLHHRPTETFSWCES